MYLLWSGVTLQDLDAIGRALVYLASKGYSTACSDIICLNVSVDGAVVYDVPMVFF